MTAGARNAPEPGVAARIAGTIGHELRNPLAAAITGASLLGELVDEGDPRRAVLDGVVGDLARVAALLDSYLGLARGGLAATEPVELASLGQRLQRRHGGRLEVRCDELAVIGDERLLERVFDNLIDNALQAGARRVQIAAERDGDSIRIAVDDDGAGVPEELAGSLFERGVSGRGSSGLGLAIVADTIAAHGGTVRCERRPRGSRFLLTLPAAIAALPA